MLVRMPIICLTTRVNSFVIMPVLNYYFSAKSKGTNYEFK